MKITYTEFVELLKSGKWNSVQEHEVIGAIGGSDSRSSEDGEPEMINHSYGWVVKTSALEDLEGVEVVYNAQFSYDDYDADSLIIEPCTECGSAWVLKGATIVDEDGRIFEIEELEDFFPYEFSDIDDSVFELDKTIDVDTQQPCDTTNLHEESDMQSFLVYVDNKPDLKFNGELLAKAKSSDNNAAGSSYSGYAGMWTELSLYKTKGGKYVCQRITFTRWQGERDTYEACVCSNLEEVQEFFGHGWLAKELYEDAQIETAIEID